MTSAAAKKAWETRRRRRGGSLSTKLRGTGHVPNKSQKRFFAGGKGYLTRSAAQRAVSTMRKGKRIKIHSPSVNVGNSQKGTYAPPKRWWDHMTKDPHGSAGRPLSAAAAGHLWFKVYDNPKRLQILKEYG